MTKRFNIAGSTASYQVADGMIASLDLAKAFPGVMESPSATIREAVIFALKTALRNATAGKMETPEQIKEAFDSVKKRCSALEAGVWAARREGGGGESRESVLARALAAVMGKTTSEAVALIDELVAKALEENGIDPDAEAETLSDEEKTKKAKIERAAKKSIAEDAAVAVKLATIKAEDALAKAQAATKEHEGKASKFAK
jgi:hypothetical protein